MAEFELKLEENLFSLHKQLKDGEWKPDPYQAFFVRDPKLREIHKASVRDRVLYQAVYRVLYPIFDQTFIFHSYSSRNEKGMHKAVKNLSMAMVKVSRNRTVRGYVLKCDIRKFFDTIDYEILLKLIRQEVHDPKLNFFLEKIVFSFHKTLGKGLPLGNVTSQLFANIYLNELDQFVKKVLKARYYFRYCDDFVILSDSLVELNLCLGAIDKFCQEKLLLALHPNKVEIIKMHSGIDFLGWVNFLTHRVLRTMTKNRMFRRLEESQKEVTLASYLGMLGHGNGYKLINKIRTSSKFAKKD